jgi:dTDP-4-amino-4,6-dideoxygalactose transaminase
MSYRLSKSIVGEREADAVREVLINDSFLGMGKYVEKFENEIANYIGINSESVVCVNSGTAALHLAVEAIITPEKNEIIVPSFTFLSSYQAISAAGALPVSCDIDDSNWTIDLSFARKLVTNKTCAIMAVHYASNFVNLDDLYKFADEFKIRVIEDAAHAFGCEYKGNKIGSIGDIICFSFDGIKNITSGEGGAIISKDSLLLSIVKDSRLLGIEKDTEKRFLGERSWDFDVKRQGYRYHMSNIFAAIGIVQLSRFDIEFAPKRKLLFSIYQSKFSNVKQLTLQKIEMNNNVIPHIFPIRIKNGKRDTLREYLSTKGIQTGIHYKPNHLLSLYKKDKDNLPITLNLYKEILTLPLHPELSVSDVEYITFEIINFLNE